ncbi:MAG: hypothetical protein IJ428_03765 [Clostridia bacterium]|nr:hypothetical protein [Clostridia bacterium]
MPAAVSASTTVTTTEVANFPGEASVGYTSGAVVTTKAEVKDGDVTNGYITVDRRDWREESNGTYSANDVLFIIAPGNESFDEDYKYFVSFDYRLHAVPLKKTGGGIEKFDQYIRCRPGNVYVGQDESLNPNLDLSKFNEKTVSFNGSDVSGKDFMFKFVAQSGQRP